MAESVLPSYESFHSAVRQVAARLAGGKLGDRLAAYGLAGPDLVVFAARALRDERVPRKLRGEIVAAALYLASPIDLVPEALFGPAGLVDDALVAARLLDALLNRIEAPVVRDLWPGDRAVLERLRGLSAEARTVFGAGLRPGLRTLARRGLRVARHWLEAGRAQAVHLLGPPAVNPRGAGG